MSSLFETGTAIDSIRCAKLVPRDYQVTEHDEAFRLWDSGVLGVLVRSSTGSGKTAMTCLKADTWLRRGDNYRVMVISYETQLVWQFAQEIEEFMGMVPGIEMAEERCDPNSQRIVVVSRASLLQAKPPDEEQMAELRKYGITDVGACPARKLKPILKQLAKGCDPDDVRAELGRINEEPEAHGDCWSRVHRFDNKLNWMLAWDEGHRHAYYLKSVGHVIDWFKQNPESRWTGMTATPKRADNVSIGDVMFPGISLDFPLYSTDKTCAVGEGWCVPYLQKYIQVSGVDFRSIGKIAGDFDEAELERVLGEEGQLARLVEPLLEMVGDRQTLIFSPGVEMAKNVARYINARVETVCKKCMQLKWYPRMLVGDGAVCKCGHVIEESDITNKNEQARELDGASPPGERKEVYRAYDERLFRFLSVCGLCISKGSRILTDAGEVPIEDVTTAMKLWDGVEFVSHGGVIFKGVRPVIKYAGLTATGDHLVWTKSGWKSLAECEEGGLAVSVSGIGGVPIRESDGYYRSGVLERECASSRSIVRYLQFENGEELLSASEEWLSMPSVLRQRASHKPAPVARFFESAGRESLLQAAQGHRWGTVPDLLDQQSWAAGPMRRLREGVHQGAERAERRQGWLQKLLQENRDTSLAPLQVPSSKEPMHEPEMSGVSGLRDAGNSVSVRVHAGYGKMGDGEPGPGKGADAGSCRKQRPLSSWESPVRDTRGAGKQQKETPPRLQEEAEVYDILNAGPRHRFTANGLIVSNCREGFNSPNTSCVAVFRPVSKAASSLAEQMKGRACRPLRGVLKPGMTREERLAAISESEKPYALIIDLVGISGLADCASTVQIYAEGLPDEISRRAEEILVERGTEEEASVEGAIEQAKREDAEAKERVREEREAAEQAAKEQATKRAKAQAEVSYTSHDTGTAAGGDPLEASSKQYKFISFLGMQIGDCLTMRQAGRIITQLKLRIDFDEVARTNRVKEWSAVGPSPKQLGFMRWKDIPTDGIMSGYDASQRIDAFMNPAGYSGKKVGEIAASRNMDELEAVGHDCKVAWCVLPFDAKARIAAAGKKRRAEISGIPG